MSPSPSEQFTGLPWHPGILGRLRQIAVGLIDRLLGMRAVRRAVYLRSANLGHVRGVILEAVVERRNRALAKSPEFWSADTGALYDLMHRIESGPAGGTAHHAETLAELDGVLKLVTPRTVVDLGCGPGLLTERLNARVGASAKVVGVDSRPEVLGWNRSLAPQIDWLTFDAFRSYELVAPSVVVLDGVVNYMSLDEIVELLGRKEVSAVVFYYAVEGGPGHPALVEFDFFAILAANQFDVVSSRTLSTPSGGQSFTVGTAVTRLPASS